MKINFRPILQSNRLFYFTVTILFLLLIGVVAVFQWHLLKNISRIVEQGRVADRSQTCMNATFNLMDYSWDAFAQHASAVNHASVQNLTLDARRNMLRFLASLPGVRHAYFLNQGSVLYSDQELPPSGMTEILANQRQYFATYYNNGNRQTEKVDNMIRNRVRFQDVPFQGDTLRMVIGAFDRNGRPIHILPQLKTDPSLATYIIALDIDPRWIRNAVAAQMESVFHSRYSFILWSPPPFDSTAQWLQGLGVIALGDTVWWRGLKSEEHGLVYATVDVPWSNWLNYVAVYEEDSDDLKSRAEYFRNYYWMMGLINTAAVIFALLLVAGLVFVRKQWLARQTALTHLAHAIRTPVARLRLDVDTLQEKRSISPEEETEVVQSIGTECSRIERAVQNASLSLNGNGHSIERMPGDLAQILNDALRPWENSFKLAGIGFDTPGGLIPIHGQYDREMIVTLLDNLLDNALRHTRLSQQKNPRQKQKVVVTLREQNGFALLAVEDTDGGVPAGDRLRIFKRFERGSDPALTAVSGLGLGLALVKEIAESHGGTVSVEDSALGGACFRVSLRTRSA